MGNHDHGVLEWIVEAERIVPLLCVSYSSSISLQNRELIEVVVLTAPQAMIIIS